MILPIPVAVPRPPPAGGNECSMNYAAAGYVDLS